VQVVPHASNNVMRDEGGNVTTHTVSVFVEVRVPWDTEAITTEPLKCKEWRWSTFDKDSIPSPMFASLQSLLETTYIPYI
jgi:hypothetical protein